VEKLAHRFLHSRDEDEQRKAERVKALADEKVDMVAWEKDKVKGAIRTDFILSAEIIVLSLGVVSSAPFLNQVTALVVIALAMTVFVYGLVAGIVKLDDLGLYLSNKGAALAAIGRGLLVAAPWLMKFLSVAGTAAMFLVGGGILVHSIAPLHHAILEMGGDGSWGWLINALGNVIVGVVIGAVVLGAVTAFQKLRGAKSAH
jgi:predicted DNA repair protein MutK